MATAHAPLREALQLAIAEAASQLVLIRSSIDALASSSSSSPLAALLEPTLAASTALASLDERATSDSLSVLVAGPPQSGKSTLVNTLLGSLCIPTGDQAATSVLLTAVDDASERREFSLSTRSGRELERGTARSIQARIQEINTVVNRDNVADREEAELLLRMPPRAYARDGLSLQIVDSPGVKNDISSSIHTRWLQSVSSADVFVVVVPLSPRGSRDEDDLWRQLADELPRRAIQNLVLFINNFKEGNRDEDEGECEQIRLDRIAYVREITDGRVELTLPQVVVASALNAMVARVILELPTGEDNELDVEEFREEHNKLIGLVQSVFLNGSSSAQLTSARALHSVEDWDEVLEASGFNKLDAFLRARARVCAVAHIRKLLAIVQLYCNRVQPVTASFADGRSGEVKLADIANAERLIQTFLTEEARVEDEAYCTQLRESLDTLTSRIRLALDRIPESGSLNDFPEHIDPGQNDLLEGLLETIRAQIQSVVNDERKHFRESIQLLTTRRQELRRSFRERIEETLRAHGINTPSNFLVHVEEDDSRDDSSELVAGSIDRSLSWLHGFVHFDTSQLMRNVRLAIQSTLVAGASFTAAGDFAQDPRRDPRLSGNWIWYNETCLLGYHNEFIATIEVDSVFVGQPFVLELEHLTSNVGESSRSAVTATINGTAVRTAFDPRAVHEVNDNKVGLFSFVVDRWLVAPEWVRAGTNVLQIAYVDGTSRYWLKRWSVSASLPATEHRFLRREDVLTTVMATVLTTVVPDDAHRKELEQIIVVTSPLALQRVVSEHCTQLLRELARTSHEDLGGHTETREALVQLVEQVRKLKESTENAVEGFAHLARKIQQELQD